MYQGYVQNPSLYVCVLKGVHNKLFFTATYSREPINSMDICRIVFEIPLFFSFNISSIKNTNFFNKMKKKSSLLPRNNEAKIIYSVVTVHGHSASLVVII